MYDEITETCPHCAEIHDFIVPEDQWVVTCPDCGEEMMLCNKCLDDENYHCDWHEEVIDGHLCGICHRGITHRKEN